MFSINEWYKGKCVNHSTQVKVIDSELGLAANGKPKYLKFALQGDVEEQTTEGLAKLALEQKTEVKVARDGAVLPEGTVFSRRAVTTGENIALMLKSVAGVGDQVGDKKEEIPALTPPAESVPTNNNPGIRDNKLPETPKAPDKAPALNGNAKK